MGMRMIRMMMTDSGNNDNNTDMMEGGSGYNRKMLIYLVPCKAHFHIGIYKISHLQRKPE